jgi:hypothetical protein
MRLIIWLCSRLVYNWLQLLYLVWIGLFGSKIDGLHQQTLEILVDTVDAVDAVDFL